MKTFLENSALKAEQALNRYGIRALELGTWGGMMSSVFCIGGMVATLIVGVVNPAFLPALCLGSLGGTAAMGLAKCGAEKWTWTRATARERETDALARRTVRYVEVSKPLRAHPLGPKFHAVALTAEEAAPSPFDKAVVLANDLKISRPITLKA